MATQTTLQGNWNQIKAKLREKWNQLADEDLGSAQGNVEQLVGRIHQKTGESRQMVERYLEQILQNGESMLGKAQEGIQYTADKIRDAAGQVGEKVRDTYAAAEDVVHQRPGQSVLVTFTVGLVAGLGLAMLFRERRPESAWARGKDTVDHYGRQVLHALASLPESVASRLR